MGRQFFRPASWENESGVAALEFAIILPVMLLLYLGMVQLTALLSVKHRLSSAAAVTADLVTRHRDAIRVADLDDYMQAGRLVMADSAAGEVRTRVFAYRFVGNNFRAAWSWQQGVSLGCTNPVAADLRPLALNADGTVPTPGNGSDVIVVVTCTRFTFPVRSIFGYTISADPTITMRQQAVMRPRTYLQINCRDCPRS